MTALIWAAARDRRPSEDELPDGVRGPASTELRIVEGRADRQVIHQRAQQRWRHDPNHHQLGGRFVHPAIIEAMLESTTGRISENAENTFLRLQERGLASLGNPQHHTGRRHREHLAARDGWEAWDRALTSVVTVCSDLCSR